MSNFDFNDFNAALSDLKTNGVSFLGRALKWETEDAAKELIEAIGNCKTLEFLNLEGNTLGVEAAKGIGKALEKHPELKEALWKDLFTGRMKTEIPPALRALGNGMQTAGAQLTVLHCSDNALGPNGMTGLVDLLKSRTCYTLMDLRLNNCGLGIQGGKMLSKALLECHKESTKVGQPLALKVFIAGRNRLENDGAKALSEVFAACKSLERIEMPQNGIYHVGISALSEGFRENENLKILNLNDNTITSKGAISLAEAFISLQKLKVINFGDCLLKTKGAMILADAIQDMHVDLEVLNLEANEIGPEGGIMVAQAMHNKCKLKDLYLDCNQFGQEARDQISEFLTEFDKLDALGPLDEDDSEGEEEEDDEDGDEEDDEYEDVDDGEEEEDDGQDDDAEEDYEEDEGGYVADDTDDKPIQTSLNGPPINLDDSIPNTIEAYCHTHYPSETMFNVLEEKDKVAAFREYLKTIPDEQYLVYLVFTILKCSELSEKSQEALELSEALLKDAFEYAKNNNRMKSVRNFFLLQLNLLKCEDSKFKPGYNIKGCRHALKNAIEKNLIPEDERNMFSIFLDQMGK